MAEPLELHQILVAVRPTRAAVALRRGPAWEEHTLRILEVFSLAWGGAHDVIVPVDDDGSVNDQVWAGIEFHDPDAWAYHSETYRGFRMRDPAGYERLLDGHLSSTDDGSGMDVDQRRSALHEMYMGHGPIDEWQPPGSFWQRTRRYLAPSWEREHGQPEFVSDGELPSGLLVDVTKLNPEPSQVFVPQTDHLPAAVRLLMAAKWGALSPVAREKLEARGVQVRDVVIPEGDLHRMLRACWGGSLEITASLRSAFATASGFDPQNQSFTVHENIFDDYGPLSLSMTGLSIYTRGLPLREDWPILVVVGGSIDDLSLALIADRGIGPALWAPPELHDENGLQAVARALAMPKVRQDRERRVHVTSCSLESAELEPFVERLKAKMISKPERIQVSVQAPLPAGRPLTVLDSLQSGALEDELFLGDTTGRGIRAPLPGRVNASGPFDLSWWCEVFRSDHQLPSRWPLNEHLVARSSAWRSRARVTRDGIAFHSHPLGFISSSQRLDQVVDNPRLRYLDAKATFEVLAAQADLQLVESPAGRFTNETVRLWGGLGPLTTALQHTLVRRVLNAYLSSKPSGKDPGNFIDARRYLALRDLEAVTDHDEGLTAFLDDSFHRGVLRRGLALYCNHCTYFGWYDADDISQGFRCWRCRTTNTIDSTVIRGGGIEPNWYYALAEVVHQATKHNFNVPVLALHQVADGARSILGMTDHEVFFPTTEPDAKPEKVEIDLWGIIDGRIILGEAKSNSHLEGSPEKRDKKATLLRRAADALTADTLVLATARPQWAPSAIEAIEGAFAGARCKVDLRTNVDPYLAVADT